MIRLFLFCRGFLRLCRRVERAQRAFSAFARIDSVGLSLVSVAAVGRGEEMRASIEEEWRMSDMRFGGMVGVGVGLSCETWRSDGLT
jgi:hypothetical protein